MNEQRDCYACGACDDRTRVGGIVCLSCFALTTSEQRALQLERQPPESDDVEGYRRAA